MGIRTDNAKALYLQAIRDGRYAKAIHKYAGERYTQHSTPVKDGKDGFIEFFADFVERNPNRDIEILRAWEDGQYVFLHVLQTLNGGEFRYVTADIFDTDEQGRMIEHWDIIEEWVQPTVSGRTQLDGPCEPTDLDKTTANKRLVEQFLGDVLVGGKWDKLTDFVSTDTFHQHDPKIGDGAEALRGYAQRQTEAGAALRYEQTYKLIGCGNFVAALSKMHRGRQAVAIIDLFRVDNAKIVEHWNVAEDILTEDQWVNSGKF